jgi:hypothetical protein
MRLSDIHPGTLIAAIAIGAELGFFFGIAVYPMTPLVAALSCAALVVSIMALGLAIAGLLEWRQTERKLRELGRRGGRG